MQNSGDYLPIFCIVDLHSITVDYNPKEKQKQILETAAAYIASGIDPKKSIIFVQSRLPEHTELAWILNCLTPVSELERMTQYKDKSTKNVKNINMGLFDYPVLMAADILLYGTEIVPVGEDQMQHIELARVIARKFNNKFGEFLKEPKGVLTKSARIMSLTEPNKKMSKTDNEKSYVALSDSPKIIEEKIKTATTTPAGGKNLIELLSFFSDDKKLVAKFEKEFADGSIKYSELKPVLSEAIINTLKPIQEKQKALLTDKNYLDKVLSDGAKRAKAIAETNLAKIKKLIGLA